MLMIDGPVGALEAIVTQPKQKKHNFCAVICHPHPLYHGTMHNKVVTTIAKAYELCGIATVRFNYRGVGNSEGSYGDIVGEIDDCLAVCDWTTAEFSDYQLALAGFSFGSFISASVANQRSVEHLISIAPAVNHAPYDQLDNIDCPWLIVQGDADEVVPVDEVLAWEQALILPHRFELLAGVSHFFHGQLTVLRELLVEWIEDIK